MAIIFVHSELMISDVHHSHGGDQDYCNLASQSLNRFQNEIQNLAFDLIQQAVFEAKSDFDYHLIFLNIPIGFSRRTTPLRLLLNSFLI